MAREFWRKQKTGRNIRQVKTEHRLSQGTGRNRNRQSQRTGRNRRRLEHKTSSDRRKIDTEDRLRYDNKGETS